MFDTDPLKRQPGDKPFTRDPAQSYTLPARFYVSPEIYVWKKQRFFTSHGIMQATYRK